MTRFVKNSCPECGGSLRSWKCLCKPIWSGYTTSDTERASTASAITAIRERLQNSVQWMESGNLNESSRGALIGVADMKQLIEWIDGAAPTTQPTGQAVEPSQPAAVKGEVCNALPAGWSCSRTKGHTGPCAGRREPIEPYPTEAEGDAFTAGYFACLDDIAEERASTVVATLRAMARNYGPARHSWDHLDAAVCLQAADEIDRLRASLGAAQVTASTESPFPSLAEQAAFNAGVERGRDFAWAEYALAMPEEASWHSAMQGSPPKKPPSISEGAAQVPSLSEQDRHQGEVAVLEAALASSAGHLGALIDELRRMMAKALKTMTALHNVATPDEDTPDLDARIPADDFRKFVDAHAALLYAFAPHKEAAAALSQPSQQEQSRGPKGYYCLGYIEHYGTEIRDMPKGKQCIPVYALAEDYATAAKDTAP